MPKRRKPPCAVQNNINGRGTAPKYDLIPMDPVKSREGGEVEWERRVCREKRSNLFTPKVTGFIQCWREFELAVGLLTSHINPTANPKNDRYKEFNMNYML